MADLKIATVEDEDGFAGLCSCGFSSRGWPDADIAEERIRQHATEHASGKPMQALSEFRAAHGLVADGNRAVFPKGARVIGEDD